jgi:hypothetical protein
MRQQQLTMPPASMPHRFCIMLHAVLSSQTQLIFTPPVHFSNLKVQRGTIIMLTPAGVMLVPVVGLDMPGRVMPVRSIIIALDIDSSFSDPSVRAVRGPRSLDALSAARQGRR